MIKKVVIVIITISITLASSSQTTAATITRAVAYLEIWKGVTGGTIQVYIFKSVQTFSHFHIFHIKY